MLKIDLVTRYVMRSINDSMPFLSQRHFFTYKIPQNEKKRKQLKKTKRIIIISLLKEIRERKKNARKTTERYSYISFFIFIYLFLFTFFFRCISVLTHHFIAIKYFFIIISNLRYIMNAHYLPDKKKKHRKSGIQK